MAQCVEKSGAVLGVLNPIIYMPMFADDLMFSCYNALSVNIPRLPALSALVQKTFTVNSASMEAAPL